MTDNAKKSESTESNEIWVNDFTEKSAQKFREEMLKKASQIEEHCPIIVRIDSYGGYVYSLAKMLETMDSIKNPIVTSCEGKAMSCGAILLSQGDYRFCGKHSRILIHEISHGSIGDVHDVWNDAEEGRDVNQHFMGLLAKNCGIEGGYAGLRKIIKERDGRDIHLSASKAVEFGIVDEIGVPTILPVVSYQIGSKGYHHYKLKDDDGTKRTESRAKKKTRRKKKTKRKTKR